MEKANENPGDVSKATIVELSQQMHLTSDRRAPVLLPLNIQAVLVSRDAELQDVVRKRDACRKSIQKEYGSLRKAAKISSAAPQLKDHSDLSKVASGRIDRMFKEPAWNA